MFEACRSFPSQHIQNKTTNMLQYKAMLLLHLRMQIKNKVFFGVASDSNGASSFPGHLHLIIINLFIQVKHNIKADKYNVSSIQF